MTRGCLWSFLMGLGALLVLAGLTNFIGNVFFPDKEADRMANLVFGFLAFTALGILLLYLPNRAVRRMRLISQHAKNMIEQSGHADVGQLACSLKLKESGRNKNLEGFL